MTMDCVTVYDRTGKPLDELDAKVTRAWKLERIVDAAKGQMQLSVEDPKATFTNLKYGNYVLVENSGGLPNWGGIIWPRTIVSGGAIQITLQSAEWMFNGRVTDEKDKASGTPFQVFYYLCGLAVRNWTLPFSRDFVYQDVDETVDKVWNAKNIFEAMNELADETNSYWFLDPQRRDDGRLWFIPHWQRRIGGLFRLPLVENQNLVGLRITEEPPDLANIIDCYGQFADWADPLKVQVKDDDSVFRFGPIMASEVFSNIATTAGLQFAGKCALRRRARPQLYIQGTLAAPWPEVGDAVQVQLTTNFGFLTRNRAQNIRMLVTDLAYEPGDDRVTVNLREILEFPEANE